MQELIALMLAWLAATFGMPERIEPPQVRFVGAETLVQIRYGDAADTAHFDVIALYDDETRTILLREGWDGRSVVDSSVLVHELVHHVQNVAGLRYPCPAAREEFAYAAQDAWLALFGTDLESAFGLSRAELRLTYVCLPF